MLSHLRYSFLLFLAILMSFAVIADESIAADAAAQNDIVLKTKESAAEQINSGIVLETMDAADYTYIRVQQDKDSVWVAMPATKVNKGAKINYALGMVVKEFKSKTLGRTFAEVIFSPGLVNDNSTLVQVQAASNMVASSSFSEAVKNETGQQNSMQSQPQVSAGSAGATVPLIEDEISPATGENSYTVGQIFEKVKELDGQTVQVRGKVVKINLNIMGKNWVHIQDGTGDPMKNSHDLVVTSTAAPELEHVVLVKGKVVANKDFGFGYKYDALIEEATFSE